MIVNQIVKFRVFKIVQNIDGIFIYMCVDINLNYIYVYSSIIIWVL